MLVLCIQHGNCCVCEYFGGGKNIPNILLGIGSYSKKEKEKIPLKNVDPMVKPVENYCSVTSPPTPPFGTFIFKSVCLRFIRACVLLRSDSVSAEMTAAGAQHHL